MDWTPEWRNRELRSLFKQWRGCEECDLHEERNKIVFGNGRPDADIMLIGEAPGEQEDETGNVFVGQSGRLLMNILLAAGLSRDDLFIANMVMCRPPGNRTPTKHERSMCSPRLLRQIYLVDPMVIVPVGAAAMTALMGGAWKSITKLHGAVGEVKVPGVSEKEIIYPALPVMHPAYILREDRIDRKSGSWERGGPAHETMKDFVKARQIVEFLHENYTTTKRRLKVLK